MEALNLPPIPWAHSSADFGSVWMWDAEAFTVTVNGDGKSFYWVIADKSAPGADTSPDTARKPFADGRSATFEQTERSVREIIGKAYPEEMGYKVYAGPLSTTFMLGSGMERDLEEFTGRRTRVTVAVGDGKTETYRGIAKVSHYDLVLTCPREAVRITPARIVDIIADTAAATMENASQRPIANPSLGR